MQLGIGSYSFPWAVGVPGHPAPARPITMTDLVDRAAALGVTVVQWSDNVPWLQLTGDEQSRLRAHVAEAGRVLEVGTVGLEPLHLTAAVQIASSLGARLLRTTTDSGDDRPAVAEAVARLRAMAPVLRHHGVRLAVENHDRLVAADLRRIVEAVDSPQLGICLDSANSFGAGEGPYQVLETLGALTFCAHVKDFVVRRLPHRFGFTLEGCPAGQGQLDVARWLGQLREQAGEASVILELWPPPEASLELTVSKEERWANESIHCLRTLLPSGPAPATVLP